MTDLLFSTKISLLVLRPVLVPRSGVIQILQAGIREKRLLSLISAPAGYGKTTAVRMWLVELGWQPAWFSLDPSDNQPRQFLNYLLAALDRAVENLDRSAFEVVESSQEPDLQQALGFLVNDLQGLRQPVVLVLEDYHLIDTPEIYRMIATLLNQAIPQLHLVITTREDPDLPLARLRVRNQLTEIRASDLRFTPREAQAFFRDVMGIHHSCRRKPLALAGGGSRHLLSKVQLFQQTGCCLREVREIPASRAAAGRSRSLS